MAYYGLRGCSYSENEPSRSSRAFATRCEAHRGEGVPEKGGGLRIGGWTAPSIESKAGALEETSEEPTEHALRKPLRC